MYEILRSGVSPNPKSPKQNPSPRNPQKNGCPWPPIATFCGSDLREALRAQDFDLAFANSNP